jgi:hypothetical protein
MIFRLLSLISFEEAHLIYRHIRDSNLERDLRNVGALACWCGDGYLSQTIVNSFDRPRISVLLSYGRNARLSISQALMAMKCSVHLESQPQCQ